MELLFLTDKHQIMSHEDTRQPDDEHNEKWAYIHFTVLLYVVKVYIVQIHNRQKYTTVIIEQYR